MLTIDALNQYGANTQEGLARCFGNEAFYLRLVGMGLEDKNFAALKAAVESGDTKAAFEAAHALKGTTGNLSLTPLYDPINQMTERLRGQTGPVDVADLLSQVEAQLARAKALLN